MRRLLPALTLVLATTLSTSALAGRNDRIEASQNAAEAADNRRDLAGPEAGAVRLHEPEPESYAARALCTSSIINTQRCAGPGGVTRPDLEAPVV